MLGSNCHSIMWTCTGVNPGFQVRGGHTLKNCAEWREARKFLGYFVWKITIYTKKNHIFSNFRGGMPPPGSAPVHMIIIKHTKFWGFPIKNVGGFTSTNFLKKYSKWKMTIIPSKIVWSNCCNVYDSSCW
jgi:hypothetical protein